MEELSIEEYKELAEEFLEKYNKLDYIASGERATDRLNKTDPMRVNPGLEEIFGNPDAELAQEELIKEYQKKGIDAFYTPLHNNNRVVYRVRKGIFSSEKEARRVAQQIKVSSGAQGQIVRLN